MIFGSQVAAELLFGRIRAGLEVGGRRGLNNWSRDRGYSGRELAGCESPKRSAKEEEAVAQRYQGEDGDGIQDKGGKVVYQQRRGIAATSREESCGSCGETRLRNKARVDGQKRRSMIMSTFQMNWQQHTVERMDVVE